MSRLASLPGQLVLGAAHYLARVAFGAVTVAALVAGVLYLRLAQGPIHLPWLAATATRLVNQEAERIRVDVGDVILTLGEAGNPSGIQFVDVAISDPAGTPLFAIPRLAASLYTADLLAGRIRPTRITLIKPVARIERDASGEFRFGLGSGAGVAPDTVGAAVEPSAHDSPQVAAMDRLLDQLAGDAEPLPSLTRLRELSIVDADLTYSNGATGRQWRTRQADLKVQRLATGLKAQLSIGLEDGAISGAEVAIDAERRRGTGGIVDVSARFRNLRPEHLAEELDAMQWLALFEAPVNGAIRLRVHPSGAIDDLSGRIGAGPGRLLAAGSEGRPFERLSVDFAYQTGLDRMQISRLSLASPALAAELSGIVDLGRNPARDLTGLAGQFEVASLHIAVPEVFAEPLDFDGGQVVARLDMSPVRIELAEAHLRNGPLVFDVSGRARADAEGWHTELRASGRHLTVAQLLQHWPLAAAKGAREWVRNNIRSGDIDEAIALMRFGGGEPVLNLDFAFTDLESGYLRDMTPIRHARGRGSLTLGTFDLAVDSGDVEPLAGAQLRIDGSVVHMPNIDEKPALADIMLRVSGRSDGVLALIDEPPLGFTRKLGLDPATVGGQAEVTTRLSFPLLKDLTMNEVRVDSHALLTALRLPFSLRGSPPVDVKGAGPVDLRATAEAMRLTGPLSVEGVPLALDWTESYGLGRN